MKFNVACIVFPLDNVVLEDRKDTLMGNVTEVKISVTQICKDTKEGLPRYNIVLGKWTTKNHHTYKPKKKSKDPEGNKDNLGEKITTKKALFIYYFQPMYVWEYV